jgi:hypothetical protein
MKYLVLLSLMLCGCSPKFKVGECLSLDIFGVKVINRIDNKINGLYELSLYYEGIYQPIKGRYDDKTLSGVLVKKVTCPKIVLDTSEQ